MGSACDDQIRLVVRQEIMIDRQAPTVIEHLHQQDLTTIHLLEQKDGVPYELEQVRCGYCEEVLVEGKRRLVA